MQNLKRNDTTELLTKKQKAYRLEKELMVARGKGGGKG